MYKSATDDVAETFSSDVTFVVNTIERMMIFIGETISVNEESIRVADILRNELNVDVLNCDKATLVSAVKLLREWKQSMDVE